jgi:hypothetical protein
LSHIIPPVEELKGRIYYKWHGSFLHSTNGCAVFRRQIQSAINEGWLRFQKEVKIDRPPVPMTTLEPTSKKVIVRPCATDKSKDKNIVIGDTRETRLEGVDRQNLKFTTLNTLQAKVSVGTNVKSGREGKTNQQRNNADEHNDLFYRGSVLKNLVPVEVVTKTGSLSTLSLSQTVT